MQQLIVFSNNVHLSLCGYGVHTVILCYLALTNIVFKLIDNSCPRFNTKLATTPLCLEGHPLVDPLDTHTCDQLTCELRYLPESYLYNLLSFASVSTFLESLNF